MAKGPLRITPSGHSFHIYLKKAVVSLFSVFGSFSVCFESLGSFSCVCGLLGFTVKSLARFLVLPRAKFERRDSYRQRKERAVSSLGQGGFLQTD